MQTYLPVASGARLLKRFKIKEANMEQYISPEQMLTAPADSDTFGCCGRFRECSDKKRCVLQDNSYAARCSYKKALEKGIVYYGKNAIEFSMNEYLSILAKVDELPDADKQAFYRVVMMFCFYKRCAKEIVVRKELMDAISNVGVFRTSPVEQYFLQYSGANALVSAIRRFPDAYAAYVDAKKLRKPTDGNSNSMPFVKQWLCGTGVATLGVLSAPYCLISPVDGQQRYLEEIFNDRLVICRENYPPLASPLTEDGWTT